MEVVAGSRLVASYIIIGLYIYILLLLPDFQEWISIGSSGQSTNKSMQTWERTKKPKDESGKKWKHKGGIEGLQLDALVGF